MLCSPANLKYVIDSAEKHKAKIPRDYSIKKYKLYVCFVKVDMHIHIHIHLRKRNPAVPGSHLVKELLQQTVQPGFCHIHRSSLIWNIGNLHQDHHQLSNKWHAIWCLYCGEYMAMAPCYDFNNKTYGHQISECSTGHAKCPCLKCVGIGLTKLKAKMSKVETEIDLNKNKSI